MTAASHHAIRDLTTRLLVGALVMWALILMGVALTQATPPTDPTATSSPLTGVVE